MRDVDNNEDIMDSRNVIERLAELEEAARECPNCEGSGLECCTGFACTKCTGEDCDKCDGEGTLEDTPGDISEELTHLRAFVAECENCAEDWEHGTTIIRDGYFETYAEQLADDIGAVDANANWPSTHIDWEAAAEELKQDYSEVTFDDVAYQLR